MTFKAGIPYGACRSTPFVRWQGSFAPLHSVQSAAHVARDELIEELAMRGGGWGLFTGCAALDTAMALQVDGG